MEQLIDKTKVTDKLNESEAAEVMADAVNNMGFKNKLFVDRMARQHRTLQQSFTGVCLAWLYHCGGLEEGWYDLRNQASVEAGKKIRTVLGEYGDGLPFI